MEPISSIVWINHYIVLTTHLSNKELGEGGPAFDEWPMKLTMIEVKTSSHMVMKFNNTYNAYYIYFFGGGSFCWKSNFDGLFFIT